MQITKQAEFHLNPVKKPVFQFSESAFRFFLNFVHLNMFSWCVWGIKSLLDCLNDKLFR